MAGLENGTWVLVLDAEKALVLENVTDARDPNLRVIRKEEQEEPPPSEEGPVGEHRRQGVTPDSFGAGGSAVADRDWHRIEGPRFADAMADWLYKAAHRGRFDRLVLVAGPQILGDLRRALHKEVAARVVAEVPKTLTDHPKDQIERILAKELSG